MRELVNIIGFRINEAQLASVEARVSNLAKMMSFALTIPIAVFGKNILQAGHQMDQLRFSIETYAKSAEQAASITDQLKQLATELPTVKLEDMAEAVSPLLTRGVAIEDLVDTFKTFAVITGATGGNMKNLVKAYTDVSGKGKLMGQEMNQFVNASVPLRKALGDMLGKTDGQLMKMQKDGQITFEMVKEALKGMAKEGGAFATIMEKKANTLWGQFQKFIDQVFLYMSELRDKLQVPLFKILNILSSIVTTLRGLDGNWKRFFVIGMAVMAIIPPLILLKTVLASYLKPLAIILGIIGALSLIIDDIYVWTKDGKSFLGRFLGDYDNYKNVINSFIELFKSLGNAILSVVTAVGQMSAAFAQSFGTDTFNLIISSIEKLNSTLGFMADNISLISLLIGAAVSGDWSKLSKIQEVWFSGSKKALKALPLSDTILKSLTGKNVDEYIESALSGTKFSNAYSTQQLINKSMSSLGDMTKYMSISDYKAAKLKADQEDAYVKSIVNGNTSNIVNINIDANKSSMTPDTLYNSVKKAVIDSLKSNIRKAKNSYPVGDPIMIQ